VPAECDVLVVIPGALVRVLARGVVVPPVLHGD
jgi:hypothetical protein